MVDSSNTVKPPIPFSALIPFLLIAFGLAWGIVALFIVFPDRMTAFFGEISGQHPLFFLAVYAPAIAAFIIVIYTVALTDCGAFSPGCFSGAARRSGTSFWLSACPCFFTVALR